jgi:hypothetical protein
VRAAFSASQLPLELHQTRIAGPSLQQHRIGNDGFVRAGMTARPHQMEGAEIFKPECVARWHGRACHF